MRAAGRLVAAVVALAAAAGCVQGSEAGVPTYQAATPMPWVDQARCLLACAHADETGLVTVDASARPAAAGTFRLRTEAQPALAALIEAAAAEGLTVAIGSAYRTYAEQAALWDQLATTEPGRPARPGHSEHEAGLAVDLGFDPDAAVDWTAANAWRFGFVLSFPQNKQKTTGFIFEPWHFRFVGSAVAADLHVRPGLTLEEWFRMSPGLGVSGDCGDCPLASSRSACGTLTTAGLCDGGVLRWCFDGAAAAVACAASGLVCTTDAAAYVADCGQP